ncbi:2-dehydro-3-deoxyphosphooctonate aldolase [Pelotomaculum sp. FP]|uniref:3-deoxy-8-phosphooctulonate synthase n=1 Tax=Pelotomaculum sp. FP TaxID=261474 RepID=UPI001066BE25|nr:3-deoxy-8-phosphooctulonate synthase [Pelotomaculum sp. FP]TEB16180.1 2-dehydro-3-deoxyphosphooctonate aldolase [Pelotomaculum sp. FP]
MLNPVLIAGPCVIGDTDLVAVAKEIAAAAQKNGFAFIFKASFDKANRSSLDSYRGPGLEAGLHELAKVKNELGVMLTTDVHEANQVEFVAQVVDVIQIPALLCRQTDLLVGAGAVGKIVNIKKGQFMAPWDMKNAISKAKQSGAAEVWVTERGSMFGYNNLVVDFRSLTILKEWADKVIFDASHSVQLPGLHGAYSGGESKYVEAFVRATAAWGVDGVFVETHPCPEQALCDGDNMLPLGRLDNLLQKVTRIRRAITSDD